MSSICKIDEFIEEIVELPHEMTECVLAFYMKKALAECGMIDPDAEPPVRKRVSDCSLGRTLEFDGCDPDCRITILPVPDDTVLNHCGAPDKVHFHKFDGNRKIVVAGKLQHCKLIAEALSDPKTFQS